MSCCPCTRGGGENDDEANVSGSHKNERSFKVLCGGSEYGNNSIVSSKYVLYNPLSPRFVVWKNLFEQFHKTSNIYFLFMSCLMQIPNLSPYGRWPILVTLIGVVIVSFVKALWEDIQRHRDDAEKNGALVQTLSNGAWVITKWIDVRVGDVVRLKQPEKADDGGSARQGTPVPCDLLLVATPHDSRGVTYVETMDLDGETNLKPKTVMSLDNVEGVPQGSDDRERKSYFLKSTHAAGPALSNATVTCDAPGPDLSHLWASVSIGGVDVPVSQSNMLFRGARMCKTTEVVGICLYTGHDTRLGQNMSSPPSKVSRMARMTNRRLLLIMCLQVFMCIISAIGYAEWNKDNEGAFYADDPSADAGKAAIAFFTFFILYSNLIPISLVVCMEITNMIQGRFMARDLAMYDKAKDLPANIRTTDINDEIGQVSHVFSDKTGTLTQNVMQMFKFCVDGVLFGKGETSIAKAAASRSGRALYDPRPRDIIDSLTWPFCDPRVQKYDLANPDAGCELRWARSGELDEPTTRELRRFFEVLALCSSVLPSKGGARPSPGARGVPLGKLDADSPDELALVVAAGEFGVSLVHSDDDALVVEIARSVATDEERAYDAESVPIQYEKLATLPFDSTRKRMTVVVREAGTGVIHVLSKGADSVMEPLLCTAPLKPWQDLQHPEAVGLGLDAESEAGQMDLACRKVWLADNAWRDLIRQGRPDRIKRSRWQDGRGSAGVAAVVAAGAEPGAQAEAIAGYFQTQWTQLHNRGRPVQEVTSDLADDGLRTLHIARRRMSEEEWALWGAEWVRIQNLACRQEERDAYVVAHAARLEHSLELVGVTAIEDKLQVRVPETISALRQAGIKVWMITGDKKNTAVNIGHACALLDETLDHAGGPRPIDLDGEGMNAAQVEQLINEGVKEAKARQQEKLPYAVVITSNTLTVAFAPPDAKGKAKKRKTTRDEGNPLVEKLFQISVEAKSVIVARATPMQKAQVVDMIKSRDTWNVTLAIGDGANDVAMIQKAHVGVGIKGLEGGQAAAQADFAIGQFKHLHRLLFVHGRWNYRRLALFSSYFFYKNAVLSVSLFFYNLLNGFSAQPLYDPWVIACFNVAWASLPIIVVATLDRDIVNTDNLHDFPLLYKQGRHNNDYTCKRMTQWYVTAITHAALCVFVPIISFMINETYDSEGRIIGLYHGGVLAYTNVVVVITLKLALHVSSWTVAHHIIIWLCFLTWPLFLPVYSLISPWMFGIYTMTATFEDSVRWAQFWIILCATVVLCLGRDFVWRYMSYRVFPLLPPRQLEELLAKRDKEPGWKYACTMRPMSLFKIVQLLDSMLLRPSYRVPVELIPGGTRLGYRVDYGYEEEDRARQAKREKKLAKEHGGGFHSDTEPTVATTQVQSSFARAKKEGGGGGRGGGRPSSFAGSGAGRSGAAGGASGSGAKRGGEVSQADVEIEMQ